MRCQKWAPTASGGQEVTPSRRGSQSRDLVHVEVTASAPPWGGHQIRPAVRWAGPRGGLAPKAGQTLDVALEASPHPTRPLQLGLGHRSDCILVSCWSEVVVRHVVLPLPLAPPDQKKGPYSPGPFYAWSPCFSLCLTMCLAFML